MARFHLATFTAEVTPPIGHAMMGGGVPPADRVDDPLFCKGVVLLGPEAPIVLVAIDWCEIRNDAYDAWRKGMADAAHTTPERVLFSAIHQHDTPISDLTAQLILDKNHSKASICDLAFHAQAIKRVASEIRRCLKSTQPATHLGIGQARVHQVASNRRVVLEDGSLSFSRMSATVDPKLKALPEGTIDPWLKTLSFWNEDQPLAALSFYATHPMSYYGKGGISADFVGLARRRREADLPGVPQIYVSGCSGNVTAGKYNDGNPDLRPVLADRVYQGMKEAWEATTRHRLEKATFRETPMALLPRDDPGFTVEDLQKRLVKDPKPFGQCLAALGLSWRQRADAGHKIPLPVVDFGPAVYVLLPGEAYVEFQLYAQSQRPNDFVCVAGYGESATGYIPTDKHIDEGDSNLHDWCWVARGSEGVVKEALRRVLKAD